MFSSPVTLRELRRLGVDAVASGLAQPIPELRFEAPGAPPIAFAYGRRRPADPSAVGFDRSALDPLLLEAAVAAGVDVRLGVTARVVGLEPPLLALGDGSRTVQASVIVGADGLRSTVARAAGVVTRPPMPRRIGLSFHVAAEQPIGPRPARRHPRWLRRPCAGAGRSRERRHRARRARRRRGCARPGRRRSSGESLRSIGAPGGPVLDHVAGAAPLAHAVRARTGASWVLVGDAAGFLDPLTGEGLHRALVSARLAAAAIDDHLSGSSRAFADYDRAMRRRFLGKDLVSSLFQAFLAQPVLLRYAVRRLADRPDVRERLELVLADLAPPSRVLDPRVLVRALAP